MAFVLEPQAPLRAPSPGLIDPQARAPWQSIDRQPFLVEHGLQGHPLFETTRLAKLSAKVFDRSDLFRYFPRDQLKLGRPVLEEQLRHAILDIDSNGRWLALHFVNEMDPEYAELFQELLRGFEDATDTPIRRTMSFGGMTVFMNSPGLLVPYHFDHETNFLLQIRGHKDVWLYPSDPSVLTQDELEDFYRHNPIAGRYRAQVEDAAACFHLRPGVGVHHPPLWPHRIRNGDEVSISLSIYYSLPETDYRARVYQVNFFLRKLGLHPRAPGQSPFADAAKNGLIRAVSKAHPRTHDEMLYSGVDRLTAPARVVRSVARRCSNALSRTRRA